MCLGVDFPLCVLTSLCVWVTSLCVCDFSSCLFWPPFVPVFWPLCVFYPPPPPTHPPLGLCWPLWICVDLSLCLCWPSFVCDLPLCLCWPPFVSIFWPPVASTCWPPFESVCWPLWVSTFAFLCVLTSPCVCAYLPSSVDLPVCVCVFVRQREREGDDHPLFLLRWPTFVSVCWSLYRQALAATRTWDIHLLTRTAASSSSKSSSWYRQFSTWSTKDRLSAGTGHSHHGNSSARSLIIPACTALCTLLTGVMLKGLTSKMCFIFAYACFFCLHRDWFCGLNLEKVYTWVEFWNVNLLMTDSDCPEVTLPITNSVSLFL